MHEGGETTSKLTSVQQRKETMLLLTVWAQLLASGDRIKSSICHFGIACCCIRVQETQMSEKIERVAAVGERIQRLHEAVRVRSRLLPHNLSCCVDKESFRITINVETN